MNCTLEETKSTKCYPEKPKYLIGVRINNRVKSELYAPKDLKLRVGMSVMVNTNQGLNLGLVASNKIINFYKNKDQNFYKVHLSVAIMLLLIIHCASYTLNRDLSCLSFLLNGSMNY